VDECKPLVRGGARRGLLAEKKGKLPLNLTAGGNVLGQSTALRSDARAAPALTGRSRGGTVEYGRGAALAAMASGAGAYTGPLLSST